MEHFNSGAAVLRLRNLTFLGLGLFCLSLLAQTDRSSLNGTVTDSTGAVVPNVAVKVVSESTGLHRETMTTSAGNYEIPALLIDKYRLTFTLAGFKPFVMEGIDLTVGQARTVNARLQVGSQTDVVDVTASTELLNQSSAEVGGVIEATQINEIPLSGRNWATLMTLAPGAINYGGGSQRDIRFNGHSLDDNNFTFDGIDTTGIQEQTQKAEPRLTISLDSIQEFRVSSAVYTAESGAAAGVQVNVVSKTGSNSFHGETFEYLRNQIFDTRSPFDDSNIPPFRLNQFGTEFGGPIIKNKLFFFANYEGLRQTLGQTYINAVPDAAFRAQVIKTSPALEPIMNAFPVGQISNGDGVSDQLRVQKSNTTREDSGMMRLDYHFSDTSTAYLRYSIDNALVRQSSRCDRYTQRHSGNSAEPGSRLAEDLLTHPDQRGEIRPEPFGLPQLDLRDLTDQCELCRFRRCKRQHTRYGSRYELLLHRQSDQDPRAAHV